jgi:hypothetical protein
MTDESTSHQKVAVIFAPLDRLSRIADRKSVPIEDLRMARQFLEFKAHAATEWARVNPGCVRAIEFRLEEWGGTAVGTV